MSPDRAKCGSGFSFTIRSRLFTEKNTTTLYYPKEKKYYFSVSVPQSLLNQNNFTKESSVCVALKGLCYDTSRGL